MQQILLNRCVIMKKIWVVDSEQAIITQRYFVQKAVEMRAEGKDMESIVNVIND